MWLNESGPIRKQDLVLSKPLVNAPGVLGFYPDMNKIPWLVHFGAFVTAPISFRSRKPAAQRCCLPFAGGFLLHSGWQNPGIHKALSLFGPRWARAPLPVIVHLLAEAPDSLAAMMQKLERMENLLAVEIGLAPDCSEEDLISLFEAGAGELPLVPCFSPEQIPVLISALQDLQPTAVHLISPRGSLPFPGGEIVSGRLYGPAIFPGMLAAARLLEETGLRVMVDAGIFTAANLQTVLDQGVLAAGIDCALWGMNLDFLFQSQEK